ncbi:MAG: PQQ-binding-like beta-propeller repeat protein [Kiritimatiellae bacterium]|nr:PQQ-binding-like beta-propeller repeat protein [Kiritimatiellia bacterium]
MRTARVVGLTLATLFAGVRLYAAPAGAAGGITVLKDLHIRTSLVGPDGPEAVIVAPPGARYGGAVSAIQAAVRKCTKTELPVQGAARAPELLLRERNVIAVGNMSTNPFIEHMYRQWYVLLDLKYPGPGGYVVRSCHNPYGTGRNVIWVGGSDDEGVLRAAKAFAARLKPARPLEVGWLMEIQLGDGVMPPEIGDAVKGWRRNVFSWRDSWRKIGEQTTGYGPSSCFGWNPISIAGVLYYMTGRQEYLDYFKAMTMPDPNRIPIPNRTDGALNDPLHPLVKNYHYMAHLVDCVYDLIEESPLFSDKERLYLTNELLDHQNHFDPKDDFKGGGRHGMWHNLCIYTGSRYFAKSYPGPRWEKRMANVRRMFHSRLKSPGWGESDTLCWVSTSTEPYFEFFMLDGFDEFVASGTARTMMSAMEILWTGNRIEESNRYMPISLLHKAAYMLKDGRYLWLLGQLGFDFDVFRIGQSFWPPDALQPAPPTDRVGPVSYFPLAQGDWYKGGRAIPKEEGFQVLSYRAGLGPKDDFFQIDGYHGRARNPYHVNPVYLLRMDGQTLLSGYSNQLHVRRNGMVETEVAMAAALKRTVALGATAYVKTQVPNMPFSSWDRHVLYAGGHYTCVLDRLTARESGRFEVDCGWRLQGEPDAGRREPRRVRTREGAVLCCAQPVRLGEYGHASWSGDLQAGQAFALNTLVYAEGASKRSLMLEPLGECANLVTGTHRAFVGAGPYASSGFAVEAAAAHVAPDVIFLADALRLTCAGRPVVQCDKPVSIAWDLRTGRLEAEAPDSCRLTVASGDGQARVLPQGRHRLAGVEPAAGVRAELEQALRGLEQAIVSQAVAAAEKPAAPTADWPPQWQAKLGGPIRDLAPAAHSQPRRIWAITEAASAGSDAKQKNGTGAVYALTGQGVVDRRAAFDNPPLALWAAADPAQAAAFDVLVGFDDDRIRALAANGKVLWEQKAEIPKSFLRGDRYTAPWFTDPKKKHGVLSILVDDFWGKGEPEIAIGRACTVEFRHLDGKLIDRVATEWGDNETLAVVKKRGRKDGKEQGAYVLAGKWWCGGPGVSAIWERHQLVNNGLFCMLPESATGMHGWMQRGLSHMTAADLDGDGTEEVIVVLSGHWNQVMVYDSGPHWKNCRWVRYFGAAAPRSRFMRGLVVADLTGDGAMEVALAMEDGWICAFDKDGTELWQRKLPSGARAMCGVGKPAMLAVGCSGGTVHLLDANGRTRRAAKLDSTVDVLKPLNGFVLAGTRAGSVALLDPRGRTTTCE